MKLKSLIATLALSLLASTSFAHEGHDQVPGSLKAMHGGIPKAGNLMNMEMLAIENKVQFFPRAHADETLDINKVKISGTAKSPKGKSQTLKFTKTDNIFNTEVDFQGSHRVNLEIKAEFEGKTDTFKFLVEK
ncbi:hypothetical protein EZJ49_09680 [Bdellovibrio bacteriovorus]|uniref:hypothetical protein n=1 Tax=Bdellovibrio bacteriovorus TaxID=959 RepID=UPI0021D1F6BD|nr:hypothetical protein [Bdellovibrio bacteriovorus]UXR63344.1 hypothetical protein EZJ49_09680 [Bdellovibrio bacteriovorus]